MRNVRRAVLVGVVVGVVVGVAQANLLTDPGFEDSGSGAWDPYTSTNALSFDFDSSATVRSGSESLELSWGPLDETIPQWQLLFESKQDFSVAFGQTWSASIYAASAAQQTAEIYLETIFYDGSMIEVGKIQSTHMTGTNGWAELTSSGAVSNGAATGRFRIVVFNGAGDMESPGSVWFDDASLTVIPEPTTLGLLGVAFVGFLGVTRRLRKG